MKPNEIVLITIASSWLFYFYFASFFLACLLPNEILILSSSLPIVQFSYSRFNQISFSIIQSIKIVRRRRKRRRRRRKKDGIM
jgi:hypothetical protein